MKPEASGCISHNWHKPRVNECNRINVTKHTGCYLVYAQTEHELPQLDKCFL